MMRTACVVLLLPLLTLVQCPLPAVRKRPIPPPLPPRVARLLQGVSLSEDQQAAVQALQGEFAVRMTAACGSGSPLMKWPVVGLAAVEARLVRTVRCDTDPQAEAGSSVPALATTNHYRVCRDPADRRDRLPQRPPPPSPLGLDRAAFLRQGTPWRRHPDYWPQLEGDFPRYRPATDARRGRTHPRDPRRNHPDHHGRPGAAAAGAVDPGGVPRS